MPPGEQRPAVGGDDRAGEGGGGVGTAHQIPGRKVRVPIWRNPSRSGSLIAATPRPRPSLTGEVVVRFRTPTRLLVSVLTVVRPSIDPGQEGGPRLLVNVLLNGLLLVMTACRTNCSAFSKHVVPKSKYSHQPCSAVPARADVGGDIGPVTQNKRGVDATRDLPLVPV